MVLLDGVVTVVEPLSEVTSPTPWSMVSVMPGAPVAVQESVAGKPTVLGLVVAKELMTGSGTIVTELWTGTWRSLTISRFRVVGPVPRVKVMELVLSPAVMVPLVMDHT